jgi:hypothetical protein
MNPVDKSLNRPVCGIDQGAPGCLDAASPAKRACGESAPALSLRTSLERLVRRPVDACFARAKQACRHGDGSMTARGRNTWSGGRLGDRGCAAADRLRRPNDMYSTPTGLAVLVEQRHYPR